MHLLNIVRKLYFQKLLLKTFIWLEGFKNYYHYFLFRFYSIQKISTENLTLSSSIINSIQTVISFLTSCVPYCELISFLCLTIWTSRVIYFNFLFKESCIQGWYLSFIKFSFAKTYSNWCFTDTSFMIWINISIFYLHSPRTTILKVSSPFSIFDIIFARKF